MFKTYRYAESQNQNIVMHFVVNAKVCNDRQGKTAFLYTFVDVEAHANFGNLCQS